ncbi:MAG TPA: TolC family outer membrane protein [Paenalcaligenes sp.]|nr:TolC family outer membrane protein [Paenalcaligenes sp.]
MRKVLMTLMSAWGAAALLGQPVFAQPQNDQARTLAESVEQAIMTNPNIGAMYKDFHSALEGQNVTRGELLPEVNAQGWVGREWRHKSSTSWNRRGYGLDLRQLVFDGFSTLNMVRQLGLEKLGSYFELMETVDGVALEAAQAHLDVQRYREMVELARENYDLHLNIFKQIEERQVSGIGRGVDLEQAHGRQALAQSNLMTETGNLNDVEQRYRRIVGHAAPAVLVESLDGDNYIPTQSDTFAQFLQVNPSILAKQAFVQAAESGVQSARGRLSPTLELRASTGRDKNEPPYINNHDNGRSSSVQLLMSYNIFRGGSDSARIRQTLAQKDAAREVRDYTCRNVQQELTIAWNNIHRLKEQIPFLEQHELATSKVRVAYMQQFQIGQRTLLDLLDTENELFDARRALANARYDLKTAQLQWLSYAHRLLNALDLAEPYDEMPDEVEALALPEESIAACTAPLPDLSNIEPVHVEYRSGNQPPVLKGSGWN